MYRKEIIQTDGKNKIVIVCNGGQGIKNFKILERRKEWIEIGFSLCPVKTSMIDEYVNGTWTKAGISQTYYMIDVENKKLLRMPIVNSHARFPKRFRKTVIIFGTCSDIEFKIEQRKSDYKIKACSEKDVFSRVFLNHRWVNEEDMPSTVFILDFKEQKVHRIHEVFFLE